MKTATNRVRGVEHDIVQRDTGDPRDTFYGAAREQRCFISGFDAHAVPPPPAPAVILAVTLAMLNAGSNPAFCIHHTITPYRTVKRRRDAPDQPLIFGNFDVRLGCHHLPLSTTPSEMIF